MTEEIIPQSYQTWHHYITVRGGIQLTQRYIDERLDELNNRNHAKTKEFATRYGEPYLKQVISWFQTARQQAAG